MSQWEIAITPSAAWRKFWHLHPSFRPSKYHRTPGFEQINVCYISYDTFLKNLSAMKQYFWQYFLVIFLLLPHIAVEQMTLFRSTAVQNLWLTCVGSTAELYMNLKIKPTLPVNLLFPIILKHTEVSMNRQKEFSHPLHSWRPLNVMLIWPNTWYLFSL